VLWVVEKLDCWRAFRNAAVGYEGDEIGGEAGESDFVGHEDGGFFGGSKFGDDIQNLGGHFGVECGGGFVEEQKSWVDGEGSGDGDALALAAAELRGLLSGMVE
jgi:hypothetical protein